MDKLFNILCILGALTIVFYFFFRNLMPAMAADYFWPTIIIIGLGIGLIYLYENGIEKGRGKAVKQKKRRRSEES